MGVLVGMEGASRRLAAVWFADIVGFTSLASRDEAAAVDLIQLFQETTRGAIDRHGGTLVKFTGDGVLAYATSTADALDAVLDVMAGFREGSRSRGEPALLRAGMHVGDLLVAGDGDVYGDGVNIASRLEGEARPGQIVISEDVWRHCRQRDDVRYVALGPQQLKGMDEPVWAYEVSPADGTSREPAPPLAGEAGRRLAEAQSIAILPFEILGGGDDAEFLAAGLHNDLLTELSKVPELTVISRTSVMGYRGTEKSIPRIARELNVGTVIEGAVQSAGRRVRMTVQLIDGLNDVHRWAESYDRELTTENLFDIQSDLTKHVTESLHAELVPTSAPITARPPTTDLDAYRVAAQGRQQLDLKTEQGFLRAIEHFEQAVELDAEYVTAWVGLADAFALMEDYGYGDSDDLLTRAETAAHRALALAPDSAAAHTSLGLLYATQQDGPATIREFEYAIHLQPSYADAHNWHAWVSLILGRGDVALDSAKRAVEVNPLSAEPVSNLALSYLSVRQPEEALVEARRAQELSPFTTADFYVALALYDLGRFDEARDVLEPLAVRSAGELTVPWARHGPDATLALTLVALGEDDEARSVRETIDRESHPFAAGLISLGLSEMETAIGEFARVEETSAWPNLAIHHHYRDVWGRIAGTDAHRELLATARRSWKVEE
jgi:class 3 adenylate cyclase/TolB-like protein/tetratricopeptide (TPR) repeat protein